MRIAIVGAGLAGLTCAVELGRGGHSVTLFDKGRTPGGRMSTRTVPTRFGPMEFDHGAQYFTARDEAFRAEVDRWRREGLAASWPAAGDDAWVGVPGMSAPALAMAGRCDVRSSVRVEAIGREAAGWRLRIASGESGPYDALAVALPAEQAGDLIGSVDAGMAAQARKTASQPCWTVMAAFADRLAVADDVLTSGDPLAWAARNSAKPGRGDGEAWVLQATSSWTRRHIEDSADRVADTLLDALASAIGGRLPDRVVSVAHRWRFARSGGLGRDFLWSSDLRLGLCGDWLLGPQVECAWLSGQRLGQAMCADLDQGAQ